MRLSTKDQKTLLLSAPRSAIRNMEEVDKLIPSLAETILDKYKKGFPCHLETEISKIYDGTNLLILGKKEEVGQKRPDHWNQLCCCIAGSGLCRCGILFP